jgi:aldose 1-epimerase
MEHSIPAASVTDHTGLEAVLLSNAGAEVVVARTGATLLRWSASAGGRVIDLVDGYLDPTEFDSQDGVRNGIMAPFVNRIAGGRYSFDGHDHDLLPGVADPARLIYHGLLRLMPLTVTALRTTDSEAQVEFEGSIRADTWPGYPFNIGARIGYTLTTNGLRLKITGTNTGSRTAPFAAGWHPYFRLDTDFIDDLELTVPAASLICTRDLIPLDGADAVAPITHHPELDFRHPQAIGTRQLDLSFTDLTAGPDGWFATILRNPATGTELRVRQERGNMHVYTGDTLKRDRRRAIALEPVEVMTNAFNRHDCTATVELHPGQSRTFRCAVDVLGGRVIRGV